MRRFEFVEGTSAKFWSSAVEGTKFVVVYGRLGTDGKRSEKEFPSEDLARKEYEKKVAEKLREGYHEVAADAAAAAPAGAKGAAAASQKMTLPSRFSSGTASPKDVADAAAALGRLEGELGGRSWRVAREARKARAALERLHGVDPAKVPQLASAFSSVLDTVSARKGERRLPLRLAMELLMAVDVAAFERALDVWSKGAKSDSPHAGAFKVLAKQVEQLGDSEMGLRVGLLLADRPEAHGSNDAGWRKRWDRLRSHLDSFLIAKGTTTPKYVAALDAQGDAGVKRRVAALGR